jgi:hypothetical protein
VEPEAEQAYLTPMVLVVVVLEFWVKVPMEPEELTILMCKAAVVLEVQEEQFQVMGRFLVEVEVGTRAPSVLLALSELYGRVIQELREHSPQQTQVIFNHAMFH